MYVTQLQAKLIWFRVHLSPGRRMDMYGGDGHIIRQVLQDGLRQRKDGHPRGHIRKNSKHGTSDLNILISEPLGINRIWLICFLHFFYQTLPMDVFFIFNSERNRLDNKK